MRWIPFVMALTSTLCAPAAAVSQAEAQAVPPEGESAAADTTAADETVTPPTAGLGRDPQREAPYSQAPTRAEASQQAEPGPGA